MARIKLTVVQVSAKRTGMGQKGPWEAMDFTATTDTDDIPSKYGIFNKPVLFPFIVPGAPLDAKVVDKPSGKYSPEGQEYINHNVMNLFVNDEPVIKASSGSRGGYQQRPDNSASIESQVAAKIFGEWVTNKIITVDHPIAQSVIKWGMGKLNVLPPPVETHTEPIPEPVEKEEPKVAPRPAVRPPPARKPTPESTKIVPLTIENIKTGVDIFNYALANGWKLSDIKIHYDKPSDIKDVPKAIKLMFGE